MVIRQVGQIEAISPIFHEIIIGGMIGDSQPCHANGSGNTERKVFLDPGTAWFIMTILAKCDLFPMFLTYSVVFLVLFTHCKNLTRHLFGCVLKKRKVSGILRLTTIITSRLKKNKGNRNYKKHKNEYRSEQRQNTTIEVIL